MSVVRAVEGEPSGQGGILNLLLEFMERGVTGSGLSFGKISLGLSRGWTRVGGALGQNPSTDPGAR